MPRSDSTERHLNLLFVLLNANRPMLRETIRERVPGYSQDNDVAFQRMFERDKDDLRLLNIPLETVPVDPIHDDVLGYWIDRKSWLLPELKLSTEERALVTLAARVWDDEQISAIAREAAGRIGDVTTESSFREARMGGHTEQVPALFDAINSHKRVQFTYASRKSLSSNVRTVEPWRLFCTSGAWYVVGFDVDKAEQRIFRMSRIVGAVTILAENAQQPVPAHLSVTDLVAEWREFAQEKLSAIVNVMPGSCGHLRTLSTTIEYGDDWDTLRIDYESQFQLARDIATVCDLVQVVEPDSLRDSVSAMINAALGTNS